jgi:hypothetical protein
MPHLPQTPAKEFIAMNSRERVKRALRFENTDRAPRTLWALPGVGHNRAKELAALWRTWAERAQVLPAPGAEGGKKKAKKKK